MEVTLFGMLTEVNLSQLSNALLPMEVTLFGMLTVIKSSQQRNA